MAARNAKEKRLVLGGTGRLSFQGRGRGVTPSRRSASPLPTRPRSRPTEHVRAGASTNCHSASSATSSISGEQIRPSISAVQGQNRFADRHVQRKGPDLWRRSRQRRAYRSPRGAVRFAKHTDARGRGRAGSVCGNETIIFNYNSCIVPVCARRAGISERIVCFTCAFSRLPFRHTPQAMHAPRSKQTRTERPKANRKRPRCHDRVTPQPPV